uniref:GTP-binding protein n=1 Tax=mine drainage metagenome TaxID=410659 RepID=E6PWY6_9ZZZZ
MKSGFVSIIGRPNAGKSTLLNALVGEKVAIVTSKPQTTRNRILGVVEVPSGTGTGVVAQIVFVDTPGVHQPGTQLDRRMMQEVHEALETRDAVILLVDASRELRLPEDAAESAELAVEAESAKLAEVVEEPKHHARGKDSRGADWRSEDAFLMSLIAKLDCPVLLVVNKIDLVRREELLPLIDRLSKLHAFAAVFAVSARKRDGLERMVAELVRLLPRGERYFPTEQYTDQPERFLVAELIRERILMETGEEVPYASAVVIERFEEPDETPGKTKKPKKPRMLKGGIPAPEWEPLTSIAAAIYCEREGQKAILIGKGGAKLQAIGTSARRAIEGLLGTRVYLELRVIVKPGWRESRGFVEDLDWRRQMEEIGERQAELAETQDEKPE